MPLMSSGSTAEPKLSHTLRLTASTGKCSAITVRPLGKCRTVGALRGDRAEVLSRVDVIVLLNLSCSLYLKGSLRKSSGIGHLGRKMQDMDGNARTEFLVSREQVLLTYFCDRDR